MFLCVIQLKYYDLLKKICICGRIISSKADRIPIVTVQLKPSILRVNNFVNKVWFILRTYMQGVSE
jgi:hypothetical protein